MPKRQKNSRAASSSKAQTSSKSKNIQKLRDNRRATDSKDNSDFEVKSKTLFQMLFLDDQKKLERALFSLSTISLKEGSPSLANYYDPKLIQRLLQVANQLESRTSHFALDSLRNLITQAYLIDRIDFAKKVFDQGYLQIVESVIEKAVKLLMLEVSQQSSKELYRLIIEQAFINLSELVHFLEADSEELKQLTNSNLVKKSIQLLAVNEYRNALQSVNIITQISKFFKELSEDNINIKQHLDDKVEEVILTFSSNISELNCECVVNLCLYYYNIIEQSGQVGSFLVPNSNRTQIFVKVINSVISYFGANPQNEFVQKYSTNFKKMSEVKDEDLMEKVDEEDAQIVDDDDEEENDETMKAKENKPIQSKETENLNNDPEYRSWLVKSKSSIGMLQLVEKFCQLGDENSDDDEFEDEEIDDENPELNNGNSSVIDIEKLKEFSWTIISTPQGTNQISWIDTVLNYTQAIDQYLNIPNNAEEIIEEILEYSFRCTTSILYSYQYKVLDKFPQIIGRIHKLYELNIYKSEQLSVENSAESLFKMVESDNNKPNGARGLVMSSGPSSTEFKQPMVLSILTMAASSESQFTKMFLIKTLTQLLTQSKYEDKNSQTFILSQQNPEEWNVVQDICNLLVGSCKSDNLLEICTALDSFYEIFSESFYDKILIEHEVINMMQAGFSQLQSMYKGAKQNKSFCPNDLNEIENGIENVMPFVQYKLQEFKKQ